MLRLFVFASLFIVAFANIVVPPSSKGTAYTVAADVTAAATDIETIAKTAVVVDQKRGAFGKPNQPVPKTVITAVDGQLLLPKSSSSFSRLQKTPTKRSSVNNINDYELVFTGTGVASNARDAAIQGTAYLTFTIVPNSTYNVLACLQFCDSVEGCVFANLYYEFNNDALDHHESSNLKCAVYGDIHTAAEKTNWGGQQLEPPPAGLTYIQHSSGWSSKTLVDPDVPEGYELVFGPINAANNARYYMGFVFLDRYDVSACAQACNKRDPDPVGGACQYFNIWRAVVNGAPATYTCSMYFHPTDLSTATDTDKGDLNITHSRGYKRIDYMIDGSFEGFSACNLFCYQNSYSNWIGTSEQGGNLDATIFFFQPYAHFGQAVGLLGSASGTDSLSGTLRPAKPLKTIKGKHYILAFFHTSSFSGPILEMEAFMEVFWNGQVVLKITPGFSDWSYYTVDVVGQGEDTVAFHGGKAPAWSFFDDITVFLAH